MLNNSNINTHAPLSVDEYTHLSMEEREKKYIECFFIFQRTLRMPRYEETITMTEQIANDRALHILTQLLPNDTVEKAKRLVLEVMKLPITPGVPLESEQPIKLEPEPTHPPMDCHSLCSLG